MSRSVVFQKLPLSLLAAIAAMATGCAAEGPARVDVLAETGPDADGEAARPRVVAQITTDEGAQIAFYNEREITEDPVISVAISSPNSTPVVDSVLAQKPSALELFVALRPNQPAPDELVREHRLLAEVDAAYSAEPRRLIAARVAGSNVVESFSCAGNYDGWLAAFNAWAPSLDGQYTAPDTGTSSLYVGYAPKFYFDVCRTTSSLFAYLVHTDRRSNASAAWGVFDDGTPLGLNERYRFFRNTFTCSSYQYRLYVEPVGGSYFRGATWAKEFSCQITT